MATSKFLTHFTEVAHLNAPRAIVHLPIFRPFQLSVIRTNSSLYQSKSSGNSWWATRKHKQLCPNQSPLFTRTLHERMRLATMKISTTILGLAAAVTAHFDYDDWRAPGPGDLRSPCPALNALANHGLLPRDGRNSEYSRAQCICLISLFERLEGKKQNWMLIRTST